MTTLVEALPLAPHQLNNMNVDLKRVAPVDIPLPVSPVAEESPPDPAMVLEQEWASQLTHLASQYQFSTYNCMKFGKSGCPIQYVPLSLQMPAHLREMQARQAEFASAPSWFPCSSQHPKNVDDSKLHRLIELPVVLGPCGDADEPPEALQEELSAAISAPLSSASLPLAAPTPISKSSSASHNIKTSDSHPINIDHIIPPDLLPLISSHLSGVPAPSPVMFDLTPSLTLDRFTASPVPQLAPRTNFYQAHHPCTPTQVPISGVRSTLLQLRTRSRSSVSVSDAVAAALNSGLSPIPVPLPLPTMPKLGFGRRTASHHGHTQQESQNARQRMDEKVAPPLDRSWSAPVPPQRLVHTPEVVPPPRLAGSASSPNVPALRPSVRNTSPLSLLKESSPPKAPAPVEVTPTAVTQYAGHLKEDRVTIGNLLLSSCPGKKIRLDGPVRGRSAVCRDIFTDMRRVREYGVQCVVCCLDDAELEFLGVTWDDYLRAASLAGLDILRIPLPEGLAPLSPAALDEHLSRIISSFTLRGVNILVHCRGGVGRAGLVACCWALKLGLCGWIVTEPAGAALGTGVRRDTLALVERAIAVVRRRRSVKAIETYEQVKFLVLFVEYLRAKAL